MSLFFSGKLGGKLGGWGHERNCKTEQNAGQKLRRADVTKCLRESTLQGRREFLALCQELGTSWVSGSWPLCSGGGRHRGKGGNRAALVPHKAGTSWWTARESSGHLLSAHLHFRYKWTVHMSPRDVCECVNIRSCGKGLMSPMCLSKGLWKGQG